MPFLKNNNIQYTIFPLFFQDGSGDGSSEPLQKSQRRQKFREREEREGRRTAFQSGLLLSHFLFNEKSFVLCTTSVPPLDRDKDIRP